MVLEYKRLEDIKSWGCPKRTSYYSGSNGGPGLFAVDATTLKLKLNCVYSRDGNAQFGDLKPPTPSVSRYNNPMSFGSPSDISRHMYTFRLAGLLREKGFNGFTRADKLCK